MASVTTRRLETEHADASPVTSATHVTPNATIVDLSARVFPAIPPVFVRETSQEFTAIGAKTV